MSTVDTLVAGGAVGGALLSDGELRALAEAVEYVLTLDPDEWNQPAGAVGAKRVRDLTSVADKLARSRKKVYRRTRRLTRRPSLGRAPDA